MLRTTLKGIIAHKLRLAMTALAVSLGVAFLTLTIVLAMLGGIVLRRSTGGG